MFQYVLVLDAALHILEVILRLLEAAGRKIRQRKQRQEQPERRHPVPILVIVLVRITDEAIIQNASCRALRSTVTVWFSAQ